MNSADDFCRMLSLVEESENHSFAVNNENFSKNKDFLLDFYKKIKYHYNKLEKES